MNRQMANYSGLGFFKETAEDFYNRIITKPGESVFEAAHRYKLFDLGEIKAKNKTLPLKEKLKSPATVKIEAPVEILPPDVKRICDTMNRLDYQVFRNDQKNYNLNIVGIRNDSPEPNRFDDEIWVFWCYEGKWTLKKYKVTTDPGLAYLQNPLSDLGTAILKEGQYIKTFRLGRHKGLYPALVQSKPVTVIRDFNRDNKLDFVSGKEQTGIFGINIHRSSPTGESEFVNKWSAGCQVFSRISEYNEFMSLCHKALGEWGDEFSYTLINKQALG